MAAAVRTHVPPASRLAARPTGVPPRSSANRTSLPASTARPGMGPRAKPTTRAGKSPRSYLRKGGRKGRGISRYIREAARAVITPIQASCRRLTRLLSTVHPLLAGRCAAPAVPRDGTAKKPHAPGHAAADARRAPAKSGSARWRFRLLPSGLYRRLRTRTGSAASPVPGGTWRREPPRGPVRGLTGRVPGRITAGQELEPAGLGPASAPPAPHLAPKASTHQPVLIWRLQHTTRARGRG